MTQYFQHKFNTFSIFSTILRKTCWNRVESCFHQNICWKRSFQLLPDLAGASNNLAASCDRLTNNRNNITCFDRGFKRPAIFSSRKFLHRLKPAIRIFNSFAVSCRANIIPNMLDRSTGGERPKGSGLALPVGLWLEWLVPSCIHDAWEDRKGCRQPCSWALCWPSVVRFERIELVLNINQTEQIL